MKSTEIIKVGKKVKELKRFFDCIDIICKDYEQRHIKPENPEDYHHKEYRTIHIPDPHYPQNKIYSDNGRKDKDQPDNGCQ
jgi:hypothetical protein